jgi:hypothetical protein
MCLMACDKVWGEHPNCLAMSVSVAVPDLIFVGAMGASESLSLEGGAANVFASVPCGFHCNWAPGCP